jgi:8-oxo-dGTP pyrophosphatase MutT (NUDIX family)/NTP pyrophosphatase (non-canonical NTP hydrolase)
MVIELIDVVDEDDNILRQVDKHTAHKKGLLHRTVGGVKDKKGRIMLVKQSSDRQDAGQYVSPVGGHVRSGESIEDAIKREAAEELGIDIKKFDLVGKSIFNRKVLGRIENHLFIVYEIEFEGKINLGVEADEFRWFSEEELKSELKHNPKLFGDAYHFIIKELYPHYVMTIDELQKKVIDFRDKRDWKQFHNPKDLALSLTLEASEVLEHFQWKSAKEIDNYTKSHKGEIAEELSDVLYWVLLMAYDLDINIVNSFKKKMEQNEKKYPVEKAKGSHKKYTKL